MARRWRGVIPRARIFRSDAAPGFPWALSWMEEVGGGWAFNQEWHRSWRDAVLAYNVLLEAAK